MNFEIKKKNFNVRHIFRKENGATIFDVLLTFYLSKCCDDILCFVLEEHFKGYKIFFEHVTYCLTTKIS